MQLSRAQLVQNISTIHVLLVNYGDTWWSTSHSSIISMNTVVYSEVPTLHENALCSTALDLVNVNRPCALAKKGIGVWSGSYEKILKIYIYIYINFLMALNWFNVLSVFKPFVPYPSCLQTTLASLEDQKLSQTVPHVLFRQTSTLPSNSL